MRAKRARGAIQQKRRTRQLLLNAAARFAKAGLTPDMEEVARAALVSRSTAYRHFPSVEALMLEAAIDSAYPNAVAGLGQAPADPAERLVLAERAVEQMIQEKETALRALLINSLKLQFATANAESASRPTSQLPLVEAALAPIQDRLGSASREPLTAILTLIIGTDARLVLKEVLGLDREAASAAKAWAIRALIGSALREGRSERQRRGE